MLRVVLFIFAAFCFVPAPSRAEEQSASRRAFVSGMKHFDLGEYEQALSDFKDGYRLHEEPAFLYNVAQCYRAMSKYEDALRYYRLYLSRSADAPNRAEVEQRIADLKAKIALAKGASRPAPAAPTKATPLASAAPPGTTPAVHTPPSVELSKSGVASAPKTSPQPVYKKWWLWTLVGVAVAGAAVGVGVGVTQANRSSFGGTTFPTGAF